MELQVNIKGIQSQLDDLEKAEKMLRTARDILYNVVCNFVVEISEEEK